MSRSSKPKPSAAASRGRGPVRKASARKRKGGRTVRFDFDSHGAQAAFVDVLDEDTSAASDLIAAAIRQSWDEHDND